MTQTALNDLLHHAQYAVSFGATIDEAVAGFRFVSGTAFSQALHDPRYIAFCKEQDRLDDVRRRLGFVDVNDIETPTKTIGPRLKPGDKGWRAFWTVAANP